MSYTLSCDFLWFHQWWGTELQSSLGHLDKRLTLKSTLYDWKNNRIQLSQASPLLPDFLMPFFDFTAHMWMKHVFFCLFPNCINKKTVFHKRAQLIRERENLCRVWWTQVETSKERKKTGTERIKNKLKHLSWIFDDKNCFQASLAMWYYSGMLMCAAQASISAQAALTRILKFKRIQKFFINTIIDEPNWNRLPAELEDILCNYHLCWSLTFSHRFTSFMCDFTNIQRNFLCANWISYILRSPMKHETTSQSFEVIQWPSLLVACCFAGIMRHHTSHITSCHKNLKTHETFSIVSDE